MQCAISSHYVMCCNDDMTLFFFQAEDGIRDVAVTGVQTCALPISSYRAIGESVRAPASWPMWRTARGARARASSLRTPASPGPPPCAAGSRLAKTLPQNAQDVELRIRRSTLAHSDLTKYEVVRTYTGRVPEVSGRRGGGCVASARQISGAPIRSLKPVHRCASARLVVGYPPNPSTLLCTS